MIARKHIMQTCTSSLWPEVGFLEILLPKVELILERHDINTSGIVSLSNLQIIHLSMTPKDGWRSYLTVSARAALLIPYDEWELLALLVRSSIDLSGDFVLSEMVPPFSTLSTSNLHNLDDMGITHLWGYNILFLGLSSHPSNTYEAALCAWDKYSTRTSKPLFCSLRNSWAHLTCM